MQRSSKSKRRPWEGTEVETGGTEWRLGGQELLDAAVMSQPSGSIQEETQLHLHDSRSSCVYVSVSVCVRVRFLNVFFPPSVLKI